MDAMRGRRDQIFKERKEQKRDVGEMGEVIYLEWPRDKFALIVNIGGYFVNCGPVVEYICGSLKSIYGLDADRFGYFDLQEEIKKLGVNKYEKIVYRIPNAGVGADSLRDVIDDKEVMEMISCGKNNKTIVQIYVVGGDIIDDEADENVEASFQTKSSSQQDTDDGEEVNGLSQAEASIEEEPAGQLEDINDIIDNFTSVEHGEEAKGKAQKAYCTPHCGLNFYSFINPRGRPRQHTAPHTVVQPPQTETMTSPPSETMTSPPVERLTRPPVQRMTTRSVEKINNLPEEEEGRGVGLPLLEEEEEGKVVGLPLLEEEEEGKVQGTSYALKRVRLEIKM
ncbi:nitrogenase iron-iron protein alpha chain [Striga asiatica]|uniref:Nitrogenase iron-iron protein alpha chain n=1 Tax=Striga asiatica TaxID=4170 RepID=A0A5A7PF63_STRAF|nr:nitrogenase iron-iron protein alpha chain [Striga asiatica]